MKIVLIGCGKVGASLCEELCDEGYDVTVVDSKAEKVDALVNQFDCFGIIGNGIDPEIQEEMDLASTDLCIAVTGNDELNLLICLLARKNGHCQTIARVRNPEYASATSYLQAQMNLAMIINPERAAAREIYRLLQIPMATTVDTFTNGRAEILQYRIHPGDVLDGMAIKDIPTRLKSNVLVVVVQRGTQAIIPTGDFILQNKDVISIAGNPADSAGFFRRIGANKNPVETLMIVGGGKIAFYLCGLLEKSGLSVTVVESNMKTCEKMAERFPNINVIHGDGSDQDLLLREGLMDCDAFVSLTGIDEINVFLSLYAQSVSPAKTITKLNRINYGRMIAAMEVDSIVNPKQLSAELILRYVRSMANSLDSNVETMFRLAQEQVEVLEFRLKKLKDEYRVPISALPLKEGILLALVERKGRIFLPRGNDILHEEDNVVIVTTHKGFFEFGDLFKKAGSAHEPENHPLYPRHGLHL